jgi:aspartate ammonia-lyase
VSRPISAPARRTIFEVMVAMAWADARIEREEVLAVQAAGRVLQIPGDAIDALDQGIPSIRSIDVAPLDRHERKLVYLCAAWLACVDANEEASEESLLEELRAALAIASTEATELRDEARYLRATSPASLRWHEELTSLIANASARLGR